MVLSLYEMTVRSGAVASLFIVIVLFLGIPVLPKQVP